MAFKYSPFTEKQLKLLTWWMPESTQKNKNGIIAEGSVRSGKTVVMGLSFMFWSMSRGENLNYALCGKTVSSTRRNIIEPLVPMLIMRGMKVKEIKTEGKLIVSYKGKKNFYYIFGGKDESSQSLIQGITLAGILFDEVALMPKSFVDQGMARCSVEGSKLWFNCNPEGPRHWFKTEHIDKAEERGYLDLHFCLRDNPSLSEETINKYEHMFSGIFYKRFILGEWAFADGVVYSNIPDNTWYNNSNRDEVVPIKIREHDIHPFYGVDYGTTNPQVYLEVFRYMSPDSKIPYFYVEKEYYWNSRESLRQKTDNEYVNDFKQFRSDENYQYIIIDPSAESLFVAHQQAGDKVIKAKNDVRPGISMLNTLFTLGHIKINKDECPNLVAELGLYQWDTKKSENGKEEVVKANDHACDALRYAIFTTTPKFQVYGYKE